MENERTENIFYLDLKHVHKYSCAKFQPNPLFSSQQTATESAAEKKKKKKKKVGKPIGDPVGGRDAPISWLHNFSISFLHLLQLLRSCWLMEPSSALSRTLTTHLDAMKA